MQRRFADLVTAALSAILHQKLCFLQQTLWCNQALAIFRKRKGQKKAAPACKQHARPCCPCLGNQFALDRRQRPLIASLKRWRRSVAKKLWELTQKARNKATASRARRMRVSLVFTATKRYGSPYCVRRFGSAPCSSSKSTMSKRRCTMACTVRCFNCQIKKGVLEKRYIQQSSHSVLVREINVNATVGLQKRTHFARHASLKPPKHN